MKHKLLLLYSWFVWLITFFIPDMDITMRFRGWLYFLPFKQAGSNIQIANSVRLIGLENITMGSDTYIASGVVINAGCSIFIADEVMLGHSAIVVSGNHTLVSGSYRFGPMLRLPINIGRGSWIGAHVTLLAGCNIPPSSLIGANSVVTRELDTPGLYAGVPAKLLKKNLDI
ncbi:acyltransferase [Aeromonas veronii]|uniref:acyltransferase n=1 Tax=Aeromonas veronii TaxID=654 RepID=UPI002A755AA1|nr:acyltransferase [Aeromonas veronii]